MNDIGSLIPIRKGEVSLGKPLRCAVFDWHGNLLFAPGALLEKQSQLEQLLENGFVHDSSWDDLFAHTAAKNQARKKFAPPVHSTGATPATDDSDAKEVLVEMDAVRWYVGETLYLQQLDNASLHFSVHLIGFVKNQTILVTAPTVEGKLECVRDGQSFVVRALSVKKAYAFTTTAVKSVFAPHPYLHLSYPKQVRCTVVRQGARAQVKLIASVSLTEPERSGAATLTDLSMGGTSGIIKRQLGQKGDKGKVVFKVCAAGEDTIVTLQAILRSVEPCENGDGFKHGFEFVDVSVHDRLILSAFVHQTLVETA